MNLICFDTFFIIPEAPSRKFSHNCVMTATWLATTVRCYQLNEMSSFRKYKNMKKCASWNSWKLAANTLIKKLGKTQKWSWTWTSKVEKSFWRKWGPLWEREDEQVCVRSWKEGSKEKSLSMTFSSSLN